jgi:hypothetical protein
MKHAAGKGLKDTVMTEVSAPVPPPHHLMVHRLVSLIRSGTEIAGIEITGIHIEGVATEGFKQRRVRCGTKKETCRHRARRVTQSECCEADN